MPGGEVRWEMREEGTMRRVNARGLVVLAGCLLLAGAGCGKKRASPPPPPVPTLLEQAMSLENSGDLSAAAALYEQLLARPVEAGQDTARFRLALLRARSDAPTFDPEAAETLLKPMVDAGTGPHTAAAAAILRLLRELQQRTAEIATLRNQLGWSDSELARLQADRVRQESEQAKLQAELTQLQSKVVRLQSELDSAQRRLLQVNEELQKLKEIDRERRLRRP